MTMSKSYISLSGQDQFTMTVTYTDASKELITSVVYSAI